MLMETLYQRHHAEGKSVRIAVFLSHRLEEHHPCPADLESKYLSTGKLKARHHRLAHQSMALRVEVPGTRSCIYIFVLLQKQEYILQRDWSCLAEAPPITRIRVCCVVNFTREWRKFLARMKRVNSKCSSVLLRKNSAIYLRHSRLV